MMRAGDATTLRRVVGELMGAYEGEHCQECGVAYDEVYWVEDDAIWDALRGGRRLLCPRCCDRLARARGIFLRWTASEDR